MELKKRNLPVSGSKPQLIERIRNADAVAAAATDCNSPVSHTSSTEGSQAAQPMDVQLDVTMDTSTSAEDSLPGNKYFCLLKFCKKKRRKKHF